jgi:16S rRNA (uracil1498-N3)-methyltransferase
MADRYFVERPIEGALARLSDAEAHHLIHVMRATRGDEVVLFDGGGAEFVARVDEIGRAEIGLTIVSRQMVDRELAIAITLGVALPKGDRRRWLVEKATELGVACLVPLESERASDRESSAASARLRQAVIEASKQCGRNRLMEIAQPRKLADFWATGSDVPRLLAHPHARDCRRALDETASTNPKCPRIVLAVGPEGGFTEAEVETALAAGWQAVGLGARILRVETAALALAAAVMLRFQSQGG